MSSLAFEAFEPRVAAPDMMFVSSSGLGLSVVVRECCPVFDSISVSRYYDVITYCSGVNGSNSAIKRCSAVASIAPV